MRCRGDSPTSFACVNPTQMPHEMHIRHVSKLRVVLESTLDTLTFDRTHANVLSLAILKQLTVVSVLILNHLVDVGRRRCGLILHRGAWAAITGVPVACPRARSSIVCSPCSCLTGFKFMLFTLFVQLAILVGNLENFSQARWRLHWLTSRVTA